MGEGTACYSAREIRQCLRRSHLDEMPPGLLAGFRAFVEHDDLARARLAGNHPRRRRLLGRLDGLPFTVQQDVMQLGPALVFKAEARNVLIHPWHWDISATKRAHFAIGADAALLLVRFLTLLQSAVGRRLPAVVLLVLSRLCDHQARPVPVERPVRVVKPPGGQVLARPHTPRAPGCLPPSQLEAVRTVLGWARIGGAL